MKVKVRNLKPGDVIRAYGGFECKVVFEYEIISVSGEPVPYDPETYEVKMKLLKKNGRKVRKQIVVDKPVRLDWNVEIVEAER